MKKVLLSGSNDTFIAKNVAIKNLGLLIQYSYDSNDEGANSVIDLSKIITNLTIHSGSKKLSSQIYLVPQYIKTTQNLTTPFNANTDNLSAGGRQGVVLSSGDVTTRLIQIEILSSDFNLKSDDMIQLDVNQLNFAGSAITDVNIYAYYTETTDVIQPFIRIPRFVPLNSARSNYLVESNFCDNVCLVARKITDINYFVASQVQLNSSYLSTQLDALQLFNNRFKNKLKQDDVNYGLVPIVDLPGDTYLQKMSLKLDVSDISLIENNVDFICYDEIIPDFDVFNRMTKNIRKYEKSKAEVFTELSKDCKC